MTTTIILKLTGNLLSSQRISGDLEIIDNNNQNKLKNQQILQIKNIIFPEHYQLFLSYEKWQKSYKNSAKYWRNYAKSKPSVKGDIKNKQIDKNKLEIATVNLTNDFKKWFIDSQFSLTSLDLNSENLNSLSKIAVIFFRYLINFIIYFLAISKFTKLILLLQNISLYFLLKFLIIDDIRLVIETEDITIKKLPWHQLNSFLKIHNLPTNNLDNSLLQKTQSLARKIEVVIGSSQLLTFSKISQNPFQNQVKILVILGKDADVNREKKALEDLSDKLGVKFTITWLIQPKLSSSDLTKDDKSNGQPRQILDEQLWKNSYDIIFIFAHGETRNDGKEGEIQINETQWLKISQLKEHFKEAVKNGLKLAFISTCNGLGIAYQLTEKQEGIFLPQTVVMKDLLPQKLAGTFVKNFLEEFIIKNQSVEFALHSTRRRLESVEDKFPCATWLPIVYCNPYEESLTWKKLTGVITHKKILKTSLISSVAVASLLVGIRCLGLLQPWELKNYDLLMGLRPSETIDSRILIITNDDDRDRQFQISQGWEMKDSLSNTALSELLEKLQTHQPTVIGLDIYRPPENITQKDIRLINQLQSPNFYAVYQADNPEKKGIKPPPQVPPENLGFADIETDNDFVLRRQLLFMSQCANCPNLPSFALQIALHYLIEQNLIASNPDLSNLQLANIRLPDLEANYTGGYQKLDTRGYQILLNYRQGNIAHTVSLTDVLQGNFDLNQVKNKIVLIGTVEGYGDNHLTPFGEKMAGVFLQAHMISQLISAVQNDRPLIFVLGRRWEFILIFICSLSGGLIAWKIRNLHILIPVIIICTGTFFLLCLFIFSHYGLWLPFIPSTLAFIMTNSSVVSIKLVLFWREKLRIRQYH